MSPPQSTAIADLIRELGLRVEFPPEVRAEVAALLASPGIEDDTLVDLSDQPFVTIDGATSRDLDQALFLERGKRGGYVVHYALADAAHFVPISSALFREALLRGASYYLPGQSVPMLPRELSEGLVSLNPNVRRRALVFSTELDDKAEVQVTQVERALIQSQAKLSWGDVQALYDAPETSPLRGRPFRASLELLREVGEKRMALSELADVVRYRRRELDVSVGKGEQPVVVVEALRDRVELYNEQISLLCNREGGRLLAESPDPRLQPIYRVHPAPDPEKLTALRALLAGLARAHDLPKAPWTLADGESLATLLRRLPKGAPLGAEDRLVRAIERQAILVNMRSGFSTQPARHFGVGAEVYARFSAPMREVVGVFLHKEMLEHVGLAPAEDTRHDEALRDRVVEAANAARETQRKLNDQVNRLVLDALFRPDLAQGEAARPRRRGTVMGITSSKLHVELDAPGVDVKVYLRDLGKAMGGAWLEVREDGASLGVQGQPAPIVRVGDAVDLTVVAHDARQDRWVFGLAPVPQRA